MATLDFVMNLAKAVIVLFIIVDPFGNIPIFIGLTEDIPEDEQKKIFNTACLVGSILLLVFAATGQEIFNIFGISIFSFEIAGGILLLIVSIRILIERPGEHRKEEERETLGAVPIAIPLLVGPGAITTTIFSIQAYSYAISIASVLIVMAITWVILRSITGIHRFLGKTGSIVITRVMALLIAAIAVQYILVGITHFMSAGH